ncbi:cytospin-A-like [Scyliorhinus torazame]|uniref:cytospin-A-like n=1 Tax=Scyliorhinus torazame TaxID=75743 RepID=UPI003B5C86A4
MGSFASSSDWCLKGRTAPRGDREESEDPLRREASPSDVTVVRGEGDRERLKVQQNEAAASPSATSSIDTHVNRPRCENHPTVSCEKVRETLSDLVKRSGGSKRNTLLNWCKRKTTGYPNIEITNFSSSWSDGLAFCALLHTYLPDQIPYQELHARRKERNLRLAFNVLRSVGIKTTMDLEALMRGDCHWQDVLFLVESVYNHFET